MSKNNNKLSVKKLEKRVRRAEKRLDGKFGEWAEKRLEDAEAARKADKQRRKKLAKQATKAALRGNQSRAAVKLTELGAIPKPPKAKDLRRAGERQLLDLYTRNAQEGYTLGVHAGKVDREKAARAQARQTNMEATQLATSPNTVTDISQAYDEANQENNIRDITATQLATSPNTVTDISQAYDEANQEQSARDRAARLVIDNAQLAQSPNTVTDEGRAWDEAQLEAADRVANPDNYRQAPVSRRFRIGARAIRVWLKVKDKTSEFWSGGSNGEHKVRNRAVIAVGTVAVAAATYWFISRHTGDTPTDTLSTPPGDTPTDTLSTPPGETPTDTSSTPPGVSSDIPNPEVQFSNDAQMATPGEGWNSTMQQMGIDPSEFARKLSVAGPELVAKGYAYPDVNIGGFGISNPGILPNEALEILKKA